MSSDDGESAFPTPSIEYEYVWMKKSVFLSILALDGLVFLFCICCAIVIVIYRKHLTFVSTGFALTYLFLLGCIMMLMSVPLFGIDSNLTDKVDVPKACMARIWLLSVGYSLSVGIMIVRVIYTAFMELIREFKSYQITSSVTLFYICGMALIDTFIVVAWRHLSPPHKDYITKEIEYIGLQDERRTVVETCNSDKESLLIGFLCFYKGGLLLVAMIIAIFKRQEEEVRSGDYRQCQIGILSVLVAGAIGLPAVLSLPYNPNKSFAVGGVVVILEVFFLMIWVKGSKILNAYKCKNGETLEFGKYSVERSSRCVPCIRPMYGCIYDVKNQGLFNEGFAAELDSTLTMTEVDPESVKEVDEDDNFEDYGLGFDCKVSEDVLPDDLPSHDEYNMKPYDPDADEEGEEKDETDDENGDKLEGESSDDDTSTDDSSDNEDLKDDATALARSAVSVHVNKSTVESEVFNEENPKPRAESAESSQKGWWKPLFGGKKEPKKPNNNNESMHSEAEPSEKAKESESSSESEYSDEPPKRCVTPHGGSASENGDSDSYESDSD